MSWLWQMFSPWPPVVAGAIGLVIWVLERGPAIGIKWIEFAELRDARAIPSVTDAPGSDPRSACGCPFFGNPEERTTTPRPPGAVRDTVGMDVETAIRTRRTHKAFTDEPLDR